MMRRPSVPALRLHRLAALPMGVDFLEDARKDYKAFSRICREQHWQRCPRCGGAVEHREDDSSAKCLTCTLRFRWAEADLYAKAVTLEQLLLEFKWQSLEKQHRHVEKVRRASPPANYAGVAAAEDAAAEAAARAGKSRRVSAREVAQRYLGNGQLPPCSKSAWLKLQLWRAVATVPCSSRSPSSPTARTRKRASPRLNTSRSSGSASPNPRRRRRTPSRSTPASTTARRCATLAGRRGAPPRSCMAARGNASSCPSHHRARRRADAAQRRAVPRPPPRRPSSFGTEQRRASEAAEAQRAWVMAQEQRSHSPLVSGATTPTGGGRQAAGLAAEQPARRAAPRPCRSRSSPTTTTRRRRRRRSRASSAESADVDRRNMTSLVSNSDRSSRRIRRTVQ